MTRPNETRRKIKGRQTIPPFVMFPRVLMLHKNFKTLSPRATKLVVDLASQYNGFNNGDLCASLGFLKNRGWNSSDQLFKARKELADRGMTVVARQGGLNLATLFALTWFPIDDCKGKLDIASTITPPGNWKRASRSHGGSIQP